MYFPRNQASHFEWIKEHLKSDLKINKDTKIISMGSCFAREIKDWLLDNDFNYLLYEQNKNPWLSCEMYPGDEGRLPSFHGSVAWERVYNTMTFKQIMEYSFFSEKEIELDLKSRLYKTVGLLANHNAHIVADLKRTRVTYANIQTAKEDVREHIYNSKLALLEADLIIYTLGFTEIWSSEERGFTLPIYPRGTHSGYNPPDDFRFIPSTFLENYENIKDGIRVLKKNNPNIKILLSVSPVHLNKTFRKDIDVVSASCASKSILRSVVDQVCAEEEDIYYFPSYEIVNILAPLQGMRAYKDDGHHVQRNIVKTIMEIFQERMVKSI